MKIKFFYSQVYFRHLNQNKTTKRSWEEVKKIGKTFEKKYTKEIENLLKIIPQEVGKPWQSKEITVYPIDWSGPSFSNPLTLKVRDDLKLMLVILIHELLHDFFLQEKILKELKKKLIS
jgi:hypothetical protein